MLQTSSRGTCCPIGLYNFVILESEQTMTGTDLAKMYDFSYAAINRNLLDLSNDDTLVLPEGGGNCLNWVLGHVVASRMGTLMLAGAHR